MARDAVGESYPSLGQNVYNEMLPSIGKSLQLQFLNSGKKFLLQSITFDCGSAVVVCGGKIPQVN